MSHQIPEYQRLNLTRPFGPDRVTELVDRQRFFAAVIANSGKVGELLELSGAPEIDSRQRFGVPMASHPTL